MCGICGIWELGRRPVERDVLLNMRDVMTHRGPDGAGFAFFSTHDSQSPPMVGWNDALPSTGTNYDLALGHRRLAIVDIGSGKQPMTNEDGSLWLIANGEIYNHAELRCVLSRAGHVFASRCDVEVILHAYEEYGASCVEVLNGIFAFALWDVQRSTLFLARDPLGVKPLYYSYDGELFLFGSEMKALMAHPRLVREVDTEALACCLSLRYTPAPRTLCKSIQKLSPATTLTVSHGGLSFRNYFRPYPTLTHAPRHRHARTLSDSLAVAVKQQLMSDVPLGLSLSGGVDSATLLALMVREQQEVRTFTIGFADGAKSEIPAARELARRFGAHFESRIVTEADYADFMSHYMWHMEEPVGNESAAAYFFVAEMAKQSGVSVLLTGQGPDELFAGYDRYLAPAYHRLLRIAASKPLRPGVRRLLRGSPRGEQFRRLLAYSSQRDEAQAIAAMWSLFAEPGDLIPAILDPAVADSLPSDLLPEVVRRGLRDAPPDGSPLERLLWLDLRTVLPENLLLAEDKMAMAASVEARVPFLDIEFVEQAERIPGDLKLRWTRDKYIHRLACKELVGREVSFGKKLGFPNPMAQWLRGNFGDQLQEAVADQRSMTSNFLDRRYVATMLREHMEERRDHSRALFLLFSLEQWNNTFMLRPEATPRSRLTL